MSHPTIPSSPSSCPTSSSSPPPPFLAVYYPWLSSHTYHRTHSSPSSHMCPASDSSAFSSSSATALNSSTASRSHRSLSPSFLPPHLSFPSSSLVPSPSSSSSSFPSLSPSLPSSTRYFCHMDELEHDPSLSYEKAMLAGAAAGVMEHLVMFPIDTVKTNMQVNTSPSPSSLLTTASSIIQSQGVTRLYRGVTAVVAGAIPSHAVNYAVYEHFKRQFGGDQPGHHPLANAMAGSLATCAHDAVITPVDVVKQRLQMVDSRYSGLGQCVRSIIRDEGFSAFYASYPTTVLMNIPFMAVHFAGYESFKLLLTGHDRQDEHGVMEELVAGGMAGACAGLFSTPLDVVKTRIQTQRRGAGIKAKSAVEVVREIWRSEGGKGFMRGASARVLYFMPSAAICWTTYETVKRVLKDAW